MAFKAKTIYLDDDDVAAHLDALGQAAATNKLPLYSGESTIIIGKAGAKYVAQNVRMHEDLLLNVFDVCSLKALGLTAGASGNTFYWGYKKLAATVVAKRTDNSTVQSYPKGSGGGDAPAGRRVKFPIPAAAAAQLKSYFGKAAGTRKFATLIFPNLATIPQIAMWFCTHIEPTKLSDIGKFWMPNGTKVLIPTAPATLADFDKEIGEFSALVKGKLKERLVVEKKA